MNWVVCSRALGGVLVFIGALALVFALAGSIVAPARAGAFLICALICGCAGAVLWLSVIGGSGRSGLREALVSLVIFWAIAPLFVALPMMHAATPDGVMRGYFDAVSALTTTGYRPSAHVLADALCLAWWSVFQWIGGAGTLLAITVVLAALNVTGAGIHRTTLLTLDRASMLDRFMVVARTILGAYVLVTGCAALVMALGGASVGQALITSMAGVSTGGLAFSATEFTTATLPTPALLGAAMALVFGALTGAMPFLALSVRQSSRFDGEVVVFAIMWGAIVAAVWMIDLPYTGKEAVQTAFEALALLATAGWDAGPLGVSLLSMPVVLAIITLGGGAVSTAGGVKLRRVLLMARQLGVELEQLAHPSSVRDSGRSARRSGSDVAVSVGVYIFAFGAAMGLATMAFAATGLSFAHATSAATTSLVNAGPALDAAVWHGSERLTESAGRQMIAALAMIVGRMEVIAAFAVFAPTFWHR